MRGFLLPLFAYLSLAAISSAPSLAPTQSPSSIPVECALCSAVERCIQQVGVPARCECIPGYRRDASNICVESRDHIDMKAVPNQIPGKVSAETFELDVTTMDSRDLWCELLSDPNTGHYKYGNAIQRISGTVTRQPVLLTIPLENHITEFVVLLSCYLTLPDQGYESRQALEIRTLNVEGASGVYDQVDTDRLPKYLAPAVLPHTLHVAFAASARGPRDLHLDLILAPTPETQTQAAVGKFTIGGVSAMQLYNFTLQLEQSLDLGAKAFWSAYLTPPNLTYHNVVPNGWGPTVYVSIGSPAPTKSPVASNTSAPSMAVRLTESPTPRSAAPTSLRPTLQPSSEQQGEGLEEYVLGQIHVFTFIIFEAFHWSFGFATTFIH